MQRILTLVLFVCGFASAAFLDIDIKDSRLQTENSVYKPGGILGFAAEFGVFNELFPFRWRRERVCMGYLYQAIRLVRDDKADYV